MASEPKVLNPIKRVWRPKVDTSVTDAPSPVAARANFDHFGNEIPAPAVHEKNSDSIWDTYEALQAAAALKASLVSDKSKDAAQWPRPIKP